MVVTLTTDPELMVLPEQFESEMRPEYGDPTGETRAKVDSILSYSGFTIVIDLITCVITTKTLSSLPCKDILY